MAARKPWTLVGARLNPHLFDLLLIAGFGVIALLVGSLYAFGVRLPCGGWVANVATSTFWTILFIIGAGLQSPLVALVAAITVGARKSRLANTTYAIASLALGTMHLALPPASLNNEFGASYCRADAGLLPWSTGFGLAWLALAAILLLGGRLPLQPLIGSAKWFSRAAALSLWLLFSVPHAGFTGALVDLEGSDGLPGLNAAFEWFKDEVWSFQRGFPVLWSCEVALMLTMVGISHGWIGLVGIRVAILGLGAGDLAMIMVSFAKLPWEGRSVGRITDADGLYAIGVAFAFTALWLGLGIGFCLIRREWWERVPTPHPRDLANRATF